MYWWLLLLLVRVWRQRRYRSRVYVLMTVPGFVWEIVTLPVTCACTDECSNSRWRGCVLLSIPATGQGSKRVTPPIKCVHVDDCFFSDWHSNTQHLCVPLHDWKTRWMKRAPREFSCKENMTAAYQLISNNCCCWFGPASSPEVPWGWRWGGLMYLSVLFHKGGGGSTESALITSVNRFLGGCLRVCLRVDAVQFSISLSWFIYFPTLLCTLFAVRSVQTGVVL